MYSNSFLFYILFVTVMSFISCQQDDLNADITQNYSDLVDSRLIPYFERFESEAKKRGLEYDLLSLGITAEVRNLSGNRVAGQCNYHSNQPNHVSIDLPFFERASDAYREFVVFHELGHCVLYRDHDEGVLSNGVCSSIMRSGLGRCQDNYAAHTRTYYINELFSNRND